MAEEYASHARTASSDQKIAKTDRKGKKKKEID